ERFLEVRLGTLERRVDRRAVDRAAVAGDLLGVRPIVVGRPTHVRERADVAARALRALDAALIGRRTAAAGRIGGRARRSERERVGRGGGVVQLLQVRIEALNVARLVEPTVRAGLEVVAPGDEDRPRVAA